MVKAIVGANWGDEGKGKITDMLAEHSDVVIRFQGGANAGHTIINDYGRFALHILPSGIFYPHITNIIGNGVALDVKKLVDELKSITDQGVPAPNLIISERAQILMPYHVLQDGYEEERLGGKAFGSTKSGIAPFYSDKYAKIGIQVADLFDEERLKSRLDAAVEMKNIIFEHLYHKHFFHFFRFFFLPMMCASGTPMRSHRSGVCISPLRPTKWRRTSTPTLWTFAWRMQTAL